MLPIPILILIYTTHNKRKCKYYIYLYFLVAHEINRHPPPYINTPGTYAPLIIYSSTSNRRYLKVIFLLALVRELMIYDPLNFGFFILDFFGEKGGFHLISSE